MVREIELYKWNIHDLRVLARQVGVRSPTTKKKSQLIFEIERIANGGKIVLPKKSGRPTNGVRDPFVLPMLRSNGSISALQKEQAKTYIIKIQQCLGVTDKFETVLALIRLLAD